MAAKDASLGGDDDVSREDRIDFTSPHFDPGFALKTEIEDPLLK